MSIGEVGNQGKILGDNRVVERLRGIAAEMRNIGASSMTPRELFAYWAHEVDKAADLADFICGVNPDGLPYRLTLSDDGKLLNWRGENYVKQSALGGGKLTAKQVEKVIYKHGINDGFVYSVTRGSFQPIADELNAIMGGEEDIYVDRAYAERIKPRLVEGTPTEDIRRWSVLAHSVMEVTGPVPFGMDGSVVLWLHEISLTQLLDMCDAVDEKFSEIEQASTVSSEREKAREKLVRSLYADYHAEWPDRAEEMYAERMKELGIEVIDE